MAGKRGPGRGGTGATGERSAARAQRPVTAQEKTAADGLRAVLDLVSERTGHDFSSYKKNTVLRRLQRRMAVTDHCDIDDYLSLLREHPQEAQALCQDILIGVTSFFRDPDAFAVIEREVIPRLFADAGRDDMVRIWHPCCATGEEVYSMAILVREYIEAHGSQATVRIFATDLDEAAVTHARAGRYADAAVADLGERRLADYFTRTDNGWQVSKALREMIVFAHHSVIKDAPFSRLDLLVCRNFLIYLTPDMQHKLMSLFFQVLKPGGFLFLGSAETVGGNGDLFEALDGKRKIYRKLASGRRALPALQFSSFHPAPVPKRHARADDPQPSPGVAAERLLAERYLPPSVVVNERYEVVHVSHGANRYLSVPLGEPSRDLLKMAGEDLRPSLRAAIHRALAENRPVAFRSVTVASASGQETINVLAEPLAAESDCRLALVILEPAPAHPVHAEVAVGEAAAGDAVSKELLICHLEEQLRLTHEQLQATVEQLETSQEGFLAANEELISINEEFQSANEELQSTNEELETSKEELQAVNEELATINGELQVKVDELNRAGNDIENLLSSSQIATLFLDLEFRIKSYTPAMAALFDLAPADVGRSFRHLGGVIGCTDLIEGAARLDEVVPVEREVTLSDDGRHFLLRVLPYRTAAGAVDGSVLTLIDISERKRGEEALKQSELQFRTLADAIPQLCWVANADGWIIWYNRRWYEYTGTTPQQMEGWGWQWVHDPLVLPSVLERWQLSISTGKPFEMVFPLRRADGAFRHFLTRVLPLRDQDGRVVRWFGTNTDITEQRETELALQQSNLRLDLLARTAGELLATRSPEAVVISICQKVMAYLDCQVFFNFLVDDESQRLRLNGWAGIPQEEADRIEWLDYGVAVCGCAARDACRVVVEDIPASGDLRAELVKGYGVLAYAAHPLMAQGRVLGTLSFGTRTRSHFSEDDLAVMKTVADQVSIAMEQKRMADALRRAKDGLERRVRERTRELAATVDAMRRLNRLYLVLSETDQAIIRAADRDSLFRDFCRIATEQGGFLLAWVGLLDDEGRIRLAASSGATGYLENLEITLKPGPDGEGPTGLAVKNGSYYICNDFQTADCTRPWHDRGRAFGIQASASVVLKEENRLVGALTLYSGERDFFDEQHVALLRQMGADLSFALGNLLREERRRDAELALQSETLERLLAVEELREKERLLIQQSRQAALGEMINNIAHQWRQPLNALGLMIQELAVSYEMEAFDQQYLEKTVDGAMQVIGHMSRTIDDFRNFFRPEKEKTGFQVRQVVDNVTSIIEPSLKSHRISLEVFSAGDPHIHGFPNEYSQVLLNILLNARDALAERMVDAPRIEVLLAQEMGRAVVTIQDNAGGIPDDIMDKIFDPYFTTKGPDKGTGIGLYMSKAIIEKNMNGKVTARNNMHGAEFRIEVSNVESSR